MSGPDPRFDCYVHSIRKRLVDIDGISAKAALDAICRTEGTILDDDSAKEIRQITFTQEKGEPEKTYITFKRVE